MAPTICPEKKNQIRGVKKARRHSHSSQMLLSTSSSSILSYATLQPRLRSTSTSSENTPINLNKNIYQYSTPHQVAAPIVTIDSDVSLESTYEFSAPSPSSCCMDERLSPYSFYHDDDNFNSIDSEYNNQAYISSSYKGYYSNESISTETRPKLFDCHRKFNEIHDGSDFEQNFPFSLIQLSEVQNTSGLFEIAIKTIKLAKRNQMLQKRLAQLQHETSEFIESVLANPENRAFRENIQRKSEAKAV